MEDTIDIIKSLERLKKKVTEVEYYLTHDVIEKMGPQKVWNSVSQVTIKYCKQTQIMFTHLPVLCH